MAFCDAPKTGGGYPIAKPIIFMFKVSVNILTKNRAEFLKKALASVERQSFRDFEVVLVDDGSTDSTDEVLRNLDAKFYTVISQSASKGITFNRQLALEKSTGEYVAILDDDDEWVDADKLKKQVEFLDAHRDYVLVGGGIAIGQDKKKFRPESDADLRRTILLRNNFFTSTVVFRRGAAIKAGRFISDGVDAAEDYDLWLRMGKLGKMYNFPEVFTLYRVPSYNKERFGQFLRKQLNLIKSHKKDYPFYSFASLIIRVRLLL